ncbi:MAG TPA: tetratricopeptide repeat protein [Usitatibacter sp.]|nr:tetratricopeptide repeat protein [Usitatibacter sp.]
MPRPGGTPADIRAAAGLFKEGRLDEAAQIAQRLLAADARHFLALHLLATIAARQSRWEEAVQLATRALEIVPADVEALCNRGAALRMLHRFEDALRDYDRALAVAPASAVARNNRGVALAALNRHEEALREFDAALEARPGYPQAHYGRGISRLMLGDLRGGWADSEWRWSGGENAGAPRSFAIPQFTEEDWGRCRRLALWREQGIGDQLLFSTLLPELESRGIPFVLEADERLLPALRRVHPDWNLVAAPAPDSAFAGCDRHLPIGSLPRLLRPERGSFPESTRALLAADPARTAAYRSQIAPGGETAVGISWRSFQPPSRSYYERRKNAPLEAFLPLAALPSVRLVDLQYGDTAAERQAFAAAGGKLLFDEGLDRFRDLDGLLALIAACDVVVSTSNVTAHLAGCLGKRTLLVYPAANPAFHYWVPDARGRSYWHPCVEIVTDESADTWPALMELVAQRLQAA